MKFAKVTAVVAIAAAAAAGCGSGGGNNDTGSGGNAASEPQHLTVWRLGDSTPQTTTFMKDITKQFDAKHPGVKIDVQWVAWNNYTKKFQTAVAGGKGPDVTEVGNTDVLGWAQQSALMDISSQVKSWANTGDIPKALFANDDLNGKTYAVPWYAGVRDIVYRKDWFKDLGLKPPTTWQDIINDAKALHSKKHVIGFAIGAGSDSTYFVAPYIWGAGGEIATNSGGKWAGGLTSPQAKKGITFYTDFVTKYHVTPAAAAGWDSLKTQKLFVAGKAGMTMDGNWSKSAMLDKNKKLKGKLGSAAVPMASGSGAAPQFAGGSDLAVWRTTKSPKLAWDYVKLLNSKKNATKYAQITGFFPVYKSVLNSPTFQSDAWLAPFARSMANAKTMPATPAWVKMNQNKTVVQSMLADVMKGKKSVDQATSDANKQLGEYLNQ